MSKPVIEFRKVKKDYVSESLVTHVLHDVDLTINEGEFVAIMGPSGSGKSTMMHIMGFLDYLTAGEYLFKGKNVAGLDDNALAEMRTREVGFIFQFFNLLPRTSVWENVALPMLYADVNRAERRKLAIEALKTVEMEHRVDYLANQISGGERQRVAIARALVNSPTVIFADEPTGNLDSHTGLEVLQIFQALNDKGHTMVMVTHEIEAAEFAKRIVSIRDGHIVSDKPVAKRRTSSFTK